MRRSDDTNAIIQENRASGKNRQPTIHANIRLSLLQRARASWRRAIPWSYASMTLDQSLPKSKNEGLPAHQSQLGYASGGPSGPGIVPLSAETRALVEQPAILILG